MSEMSEISETPVLSLAWEEYGIWRVGVGWEIGLYSDPFMAEAARDDFSACNPDACFEVRRYSARFVATAPRGELSAAEMDDLEVLPLTGTMLDALYQAFRAGFASSGKGLNGSYMTGDHPEVICNIIHKRFENFLKGWKYLGLEPPPDDGSDSVI